MKKLAAALVLFGALFATPAAADDVECWRDPGPPPVHRCRPIQVHARQPGFILLNRTPDRHDAAPLERRMTPEILRTVRRNPF